VLLDAHVGKALADGELFARLHRRAEGCAELEHSGVNLL